MLQMYFVISEETNKYQSQPSFYNYQHVNSSHPQSIYEPGKRHWLKVKKDYLCDGAMADSADLVVLGAWYGTGKKGQYD